MLAEKHGGVHEHMKVMTSRRGIEVLVAGIRKILVVRRDRAFALRQRPRIVAAKHIDMRGHVLQVTGVGRQPAQHVGSLQGALRGRRQFQRMENHVENSWMNKTTTLDPVHPAFQHRHDLARAGMRVGLSGFQVPELTRRAGNRGLDIEGGDVAVILMRPVNVTHRVGIVPVPSVQGLVIAFMAILVASFQSSNNGLLGRCRIVGKRYRSTHCVMTNGHRVGNLGIRVAGPRSVVEGSCRIRYSPPGHGAVRIFAGRSPEAGNRFLVVEGVGPIQAAIEPMLGSVRTR